MQLCGRKLAVKNHHVEKLTACWYCPKICKYQAVVRGSGLLLQNLQFMALLTRYDEAYLGIGPAKKEEA